MHTTIRNRCLVTGHEDLEHLYTFKLFPVFMGCVDNDGLAEDLLCDMSWWISRSSGSIQLNPIPNPNLVYSASHGSGTIGATWKSHHSELAEFIQRVRGRRVLEIGGGHGFLANYTLDRDDKCHWTLVDPNPTCRSRDNLHVVKGFFHVDVHQKFDTIVHSHLFEHMLDPLAFCSQIYDMLEDGGHLVFSVPNLREMFERKYTNILNFEHTFFLDEYFTVLLLQKAGFQILETSFFNNDHSIFYSFKKQEIPIDEVELINHYEDNARLFTKNLDHHRELISYLNKIIDKAAGNVFLFGGHVISQFLLAFGLNPNKIKSIIDNDPAKWGKRLSGTNLRVFSPDILKDEESPVVILRAGTFQAEISDQLKSINQAIVIP